MGRAEVAVSNAQWDLTAAGVDGVGGAEAQGRVNMVQRMAGLFRRTAGDRQRFEGPAEPSLSLQCSVMTMELPVESIALPSWRRRSRRGGHSLDTGKGFEFRRCACRGLERMSSSTCSDGACLEGKLLAEGQAWF